MFGQLSDLKVAVVGVWTVVRSEGGHGRCLDSGQI